MDQQLMRLLQQQAGGGRAQRAPQGETIIADK
jgi:hypothetical protein